MPVTPLLQYFRAAPYTGQKGTSWGETRVAEAKRLLADPSQLAKLFAESVAIVEAEYRNYQPFYPEYHRFGSAKGKEHGEALGATVDVAARLSRREVWDVPDNPRLSFRYLDREIQIARSKPAPRELASGSTLLLDLFLTNAQDRMPILCELKLRKDQCALYALIQVLTQAAYAATPSQRERFVLFGSKPEFVLREAVPNKPATLDLYILLVEKPEVKPYTDIHPLAVELSKKLIADSSVGRRIRRIAWIEAKDDKNGGLTLTSSQFSASKLREPKSGEPLSPASERVPSTSTLETTPTGQSNRSTSSCPTGTAGNVASAAWRTCARAFRRAACRSTSSRLSPPTD